MMRLPFSGFLTPLTFSLFLHAFLRCLYHADSCEHSKCSTEGGICEERPRGPPRCKCKEGWKGDYCEQVRIGAMFVCCVSVFSALFIFFLFWILISLFWFEFFLFHLESYREQICRMSSTEIGLVW